MKNTYVLLKYFNTDIYNQLTWVTLKQMCKLLVQKFI